MKILIVCSGNFENFKFEKHQVFIHEQVSSIKKNNPSIQFDYFFIEGKGVFGYLKNLKRLKSKVRSFKPNLIHAHFGISGFLANLQKISPVITTFHGSDIQASSLNKVISTITFILSKHAIFVNRTLKDELKAKIKYSVIPCGVNLEDFKIISKEEAKNQLGLENDKIYILFSSSFCNKVKNYELAKKAIELVDVEVELIELKNKSRMEVIALLNAVDLVLVTSHRESGPLIVKEAMATNTPIVTKKVGDVEDVIGETEGCFIVDSDEPLDFQISIQNAIEYSKKNIKTIGRKRMQDYDNKIIASKVYDVYGKNID